jgi:hypothetical protein
VVAGKMKGDIPHFPRNRANGKVPLRRVPIC